MKLCFPTQSDNGSEALICAHFGSAPYFILFDQGTKEYESIPTPKINHEHGQCSPMDLLAKRGIVAVVCKGMGKSAIAAIERQNIKVFTTQGETVKDAIAEFMAGKLAKLDPATGCKGHSCDHG